MRRTVQRRLTLSATLPQLRLCSTVDRPTSDAGDAWTTQTPPKERTRRATTRQTRIPPEAKFTHARPLDGRCGSRDRMGVAVLMARNWRMVENLFFRDGEKWTVEELRLAWKRCVYAHLDDDRHQLRPSAASSQRPGRQFLEDLTKATLYKLEKNDWKMTGKQARDIGWSAGKQWFMDAKLVEAIQTGVLNGVANQEIELYEAIPVAWAIANSGHYPVRLFESFTQHIAEVHSHLNLQHCTNILWSMAVCGYHPGSHFLQTLSQLANDLIEADAVLIIPQAIADLVTPISVRPERHEALVHQATNWAYSQLSTFSPEELLTMGMGLAMLESLGLEDMRTIAVAFNSATKEQLLDVYIDQFVALSLLFAREHRQELHETAFGAEAAESILIAHHDRQAQIAVQQISVHDECPWLISRQLDKVAEGKYEIGTLTADRNLALEILVHGEEEDYSVIPVYPMSRSRNNPEIELGEVRIAQKLIEAEGIKFGGFLEWITPEDTTPLHEQTHTL